MKVKKTPLRRCIACGESKEKKNLIRIVKNKEKDIFVDKTNKANGRGAYICIKEDCFEEAEKKKKLSKSLKIEVPNQIYQDLKNELILKSEK